MRISFDRWQLLLEVQKDLRVIHGHVVALRCELNMQREMLETLAGGVAPAIVERLQAIAVAQQARTAALERAVAAATPPPTSDPDTPAKKRPSRAADKRWTQPKKKES